jgi:hypothetical protein
MNRKFFRNLLSSGMSAGSQHNQVLGLPLEMVKGNSVDEALQSLF